MILYSNEKMNTNKFLIDSVIVDNQMLSPKSKTLKENFDIIKIYVLNIKQNKHINEFLDSTKSEKLKENHKKIEKNCLKE